LFAGELTFEAAFITEVKALASIPGEINASVSMFEVGVGAQDGMIEEVEGKSINDGSPEWFDEIEGEGGAFVLGFVQEAEGWIEADGMEDGFHFANEKRVSVREDGIGGIVRGAS
jgi:hypothetical protein